MEVTSLLAAVGIGLAVGASGWFLVPHGRTRTVWSAVVVGMVAAVIGTVVARVVGVASSPGINWLELTFQLSFAAAGVAGLARITGRQGMGSGSRGAT